MLSRTVRRTRGFTLIEMLLILGLLMVLMLFTWPSLLQYFHRAAMIEIARQSGSLMQVARFEAVKRNRPARVEFDMTQGEVRSYADLNSNGVFDPATEALVGKYPLPKGVYFWGPPDAAERLDSSVDMFNHSPAAAPFDMAWVTYDPTGSVAQSGAVRFGDKYGNFLEIRIKDLAGARVQLAKWNDTTSTWAGEGSAGKGWTWK